MAMYTGTVDADVDIDMGVADDPRRFSIMNVETGEVTEIEEEIDLPLAGATSGGSVAPVSSTSRFATGERVVARIVNRSVVNDAKQKAHTMYVVNVWRETRPTTPWVVYRRYSDFLDLHDRLKKKGLVLPAFPGKKVLGLFDDSFLDKRQAALGMWLDNVTNTYSALSSVDRDRVDEVRIFLTRDANMKPQGFGASKASAAAAAAAASPKAATTSSSSSSSRSSRKSKKKVGLHSFELLKVIGKGAFGKVVLARKKGSDNVYAMKILNKSNIIRRNQVEHTKTERRVLGYTRHPNVVGLHYAFQSRKKLYFVLDYCAGGELFFHLGRMGRFDERMTCFYTAQLVLALGHLHSYKVVYRDMKPENVLLDANGNIKIADFGLSKENIAGPTSGTASFCGTPEYLAPEILARKGHGTAVDWWSLGMLVYEMLTGLPPWYTRDRKKLYESIRSAPLDIPKHISPLAASLLRGLLNRDPAKRLGGGARDSLEVMEHKFFAGIDWAKLRKQELKPAFLPSTTSKTDTRYFEAEFTNMSVGEVVSESLSASVPNGPSFNNFTFTSPSDMSFRMRGRGDSTMHMSPPTPDKGAGAAAGVPSGGAGGGAGVGGMASSAAITIQSPAGHYVRT